MQNSNDLEEPKILFDQAFIDSLPELQTYWNPSVVMLCRHLHTYRTKVESWFTRLPESEKKDIRSRLRSTKESAFTSAMFELYLHEYCLMNNWKPERNPVVDGLTPDFLIDTNNFGDFYLEAANVFQPPDMLEQQRVANALLHKLNDIDLPFVGSLVLEEWPVGQLAPAKIARNVKHKLNIAISEGRAAKVTIDLAEYALKGALSVKFSNDAKKMSLLYRPPLGLGLPSAPTMDSALHYKAQKYKNLAKPYVISICTTDVFPLNDHTLERALYDIDGLFKPRASDSKLSNTNVSAVLYAEIETVNEEWRYSLRVYHNEWAKHRLSEQVFETLPQLSSKQTETGKKMTWSKEPRRHMTPIFG